MTDVHSYTQLIAHTIKKFVILHVLQTSIKHCTFTKQEQYCTYKNDLSRPTLQCSLKWDVTH